MSKDTRLKKLEDRLGVVKQEDFEIEHQFIRPDGSISLTTSLIVHKKGMTKEEIEEFNQINHYDKLRKG